MAAAVFLDTGPLVAFFNRRDQYHGWAFEAFSNITAPMVTCEAVLSETLFITKNNPVVVDALMGMMRDGLIVVKPVFNSDSYEVLQQVLKYADLPGSLADLSLVYLFQQAQTKVGHILTTDSNFTIYRASNGNGLKLKTPYLV